MHVSRRIIYSHLLAEQNNLTTITDLLLLLISQNRPCEVNVFYRQHLCQITVVAPIKINYNTGYCMSAECFCCSTLICILLANFVMPAGRVPLQRKYTYNNWVESRTELVQCRYFFFFILFQLCLLSGIYVCFTERYEIRSRMLVSLIQTSAGTT